MRLRKRLLFCFLILFSVLIICAVASAYRCERSFVCTSYTISGCVENEIRIVHLTDLHNKQFGEGNSQLLDSIQTFAPNLICMTGDMINRDDPEIQITLEFVSGLTEIAPVYYGYGNHETSWERQFGGSLRQSLEEAGAIVVDNGYVETECNETTVRIGGYAGYYRQPGMLTKDAELAEKEILFAEAFEDTSLYKILLCHIPTAWLDWGYMNQYAVDLVLCGHYHGGQIRIPGIGGVYAPYVGLFPSYTKGLFQGEKATVVLSAGLGSARFLPRINNPGEIVFITILPQGEGIPTA